MDLKEFSSPNAAPRLLEYAARIARSMGGSPANQALLNVIETSLEIGQAEQAESFATDLDDELYEAIAFAKIAKYEFLNIRDPRDSIDRAGIKAHDAIERFERRGANAYNPEKIIKLFCELATLDGAFVGVARGLKPRRFTGPRQTAARKRPTPRPSATAANLPGPTQYLERALKLSKGLPEREAGRSFMEIIKTATDVGEAMFVESMKSELPRDEYARAVSQLMIAREAILLDMESDVSEAVAAAEALLLDWENGRKSSASSAEMVNLYCELAKTSFLLDQDEI